MAEIARVVVRLPSVRYRITLAVIWAFARLGPAISERRKDAIAGAMIEWMFAGLRIRVCPPDQISVGLEG